MAGAKAVDLVYYPVTIEQRPGSCPGHPQRRSRTLRSIPLACALWLALGGIAHATDVEVDATTVGQGYQVAGGDGTLLTRRRIDQYLGLHVWNFGPHDALGRPTPDNQLYFTSSMRFESDLGDWAVKRLGGRDVAEDLGSNRLDLLFAYLGVRDLAGFIDLKLGRQIEFDNFEFVSYDGLSLDLKTPIYLAAEVYGGLLVNGAMPIDSPIYRPDGTAPSSLSVHDADFKPLLGVVVRSFGLRHLDLRMMYRQVWSPAQHSTLDEAASGARDGTSEQKLGWSARGSLFAGRVVPWFGLRYDLLVAAIDVIEAGLRVSLARRHGITLEYLYSYPTFDGDSIWNLFVRRQFDDVRLGYDLRVGRWRAYAKGLVRWFHDGEGAQSTGLSSTSTWSRLDAGGNLGARVDMERGFVRLDGYLEMGYGGTRVGVDAATRMRIYGDWLAAEGRLTYAHFVDDIRAEASADSFGFQLGARLALSRGVLLHILFEDNINRFYDSQLRVYAVLDIAFLANVNGFSAAPLSGTGPGLGQFGPPLGMGRAY